MDLNLKLSDTDTDSDVPDKIWDLLIVGAGPAGFSASIYSLRYGLDTLIIGEDVGGLMTENPVIENFPGFGEVDGEDLALDFKKHNKSLGGYLVEKRVKTINKSNDLFIVSTVDGEKYKSKTLIYSAGTKRRKLNVPGEEELFGKGVTYCATCDAPFTKDKIVAVIGGGDSGFISSIQVSEYAKKVYLIHRRDEFRARKSLIKKAEEKGVNFIKCAETIRFNGENNLESIDYKDINTDEEKSLEISHVFIEIGHIPTTSLLKENFNIKVDDSGYIMVNEDMSTNIEGLYAAGDCTNGSNKMAQIITASSEGAIASESVYKLLKH